MSTEQKSLGQIAWEIETECYGWQWSEETEEYRAHWERIAQAVAEAVIDRQKSAPQPTADERVAEHMHTVEDAVSQAAWSWQGPSRDLMAPYIAAVEQSARALLSASQEDAEHAAMYRWLRYADLDALAKANWGDGDVYQGEQFDAAIRAAMKEQKA